MFLPRCTRSDIRKSRTSEAHLAPNNWIASIAASRAYIREKEGDSVSNMTNTSLLVKTLHVFGSVLVFAGVLSAACLAAVANGASSGGCNH